MNLILLQSTHYQPSLSYKTSRAHPSMIATNLLRNIKFTLPNHWIIKYSINLVASTALSFQC